MVGVTWNDEEEGERDTNFGNKISTDKSWVMVINTNKDDVHRLNIKRTRVEVSGNFYLFGEWSYTRWETEEEDGRCEGVRAAHKIIMVKDKSQSKKQR